MFRKEFKCNKTTLIFVASYYVYLVASIWAQTAFKTTYDETIINLIQWMAILLILVKIFSDGTVCKKNLFIWITFMLLCILISIFSTNYRYVIPIAAYILAGSNMDSDVLIKTAFVAIVSMTMLTVVSSLIGIIPFEYSVNGTRIRYNMGFLYTTYLSNYFFHALLMWLFVKKKCPNLIESAIILAINHIIYELTATRAVFYETILLIAICWMGRLIKKNLACSKFRYLFLTSYVACALIAIGISINYNSGSPWMNALNILLSYRLSLGIYAFNQYGFSLLGQPVEWNSFGYARGTAYFYVDSSYMNIPIEYGVIWLLLLLLGFTMLMKKYVAKDKLYCCIALLFLAIHSMTDPQLYSLICNPFLFLLGGFYPFSKRYHASSLRNEKRSIVNQNAPVLMEPLYRRHQDV